MDYIRNPEDSDPTQSE